jgi:hypothetical protein
LVTFTTSIPGATALSGSGGNVGFVHANTYIVVENILGETNMPNTGG